eukprot:Lithocolla_globosa_v1_NODE_10466_length_596_cov_3.101664.p2 type:complete len:102 gc:universal NODE_10466_length_596_cov_3.101664:390-85(-)
MVLHAKFAKELTHRQTTKSSSMMVSTMKIEVAFINTASALITFPLVRGCVHNVWIQDHSSSRRFCRNDCVLEKPSIWSSGKNMMKIIHGNGLTRSPLEHDI